MEKKDINTAEGKGYFVAEMGKLLDQFEMHYFDLNFHRNEVGGKIEQVVLEIKL